MCPCNLCSKGSVLLFVYVVYIYRTFKANRRWWNTSQQQIENTHAEVFTFSGSAPIFRQLESTWFCNSLINYMSCKMGNLTTFDPFYMFSKVSGFFSVPLHKTVEEYELDKLTTYSYHSHTRFTPLKCLAYTYSLFFQWLSSKSQKHQKLLQTTGL